MTTTPAIFLALLGACQGTAQLVSDDALSPAGKAGEDAGAPPPSDTANPLPADAFGARGTSVAMPPMEVVRFVALGDAGEGNALQYQVADAMQVVCAARGCDFALYLGDNFYDTGVEEIDDPQFEEKFELPYVNLSFPFWITLGNHDYGGGGSGIEFWKGGYYIDYAEKSDKWTFPDLFYDVDYGVLELYSLDTNAMMWGFYDDQQEWLQARLAASDAPWTIGFGHHPYLSNGPHGNAGIYEGYAPNPIWDGATVKTFFDDNVCGQIDVYLCGHDHSRQWNELTCGGTELIVSGAGAKASYLEGNNPVWFEKDTEGFLWVELTATSFTGVFYNENGTAEFERTITK